MIPILSALLVLVGGSVAGLSLYLLTLAAAALIHRDHPPPPLRLPRSRLVVLIPAHDEEQLIARCVGSLVAQDRRPHPARGRIVKPA